MDISTLLLCILGGSGFYAVLQLLLNRIFKHRDDSDERQKTICYIQKKLIESDINDSKILLLILMEHYPRDHQAILSEAERYFIELKCDSWMAQIFVNWAKQENVNIDYIIAAHDRNHKSE